MEQIEFLVKGSSLEPYVVTFTKESDNLNAYCTCRAGLVGTYCKHRINILNGVKEGIVSNNAREVEIVMSWLVGSDLEKALSDYEVEENVFQEAALVFEKAKKRLSKAKKAIAEAMRK
jgi:uncharacterized Zn finger protein